METKIKRYLQRKRRIKVIGTADRPRLSVFRSNAHIYGQVIDDDKSKTLVSFSDLILKKGAKMSAQGGSASGRNKVQTAELVGEELAKAAIAKKIKKVVFDRNGFMYHGRVKAVAEGARKGGLEF